MENKANILLHMALNTKGADIVMDYQLMSNILRGVSVSPKYRSRQKQQCRNKDMCFSNKL